MEHNFYRAFEDKYRGSRALIKTRLEFYLPFIEPLKKLYDNPKAVDLGCGRGEWLELLQENGFEALGVDLDEQMLAGCAEMGLPTQKQDIIECLRNLENESQTIVSAFHVVEHIPFETLELLIKEAFRVLKPCGLLILETPNSENIVVGCVNFYLVPTHQKPIPPQLLSFVTEMGGFTRNNVIRLQENKEILSKNEISLNDVLGGVSPNYSIIAQKAGIGKHLKLFDEQFQTAYGLKLQHLAELFQQGMINRFLNIKNQQEQLQIQVDEFKNEIRTIEAYLIQKSEQIEKKNEQIQQKNEQIHDLLLSSSWRITAPLRFITSLIGKILKKVKITARFVKTRIVKPLLLKIRKFLLRLPIIGTLTSKMFRKFPKLQLAYKQHLGSSTEREVEMTQDMRNQAPNSELTGSAESIFNELKNKIGL